MLLKIFREIIVLYDGRLGEEQAGVFWIQNYGKRKFGTRGKEGICEKKFPDIGIWQIGMLI
jgi:hypothetical protein